MKANGQVCAVVPVKDTTAAKQRLAGVLSGAQRRALALAMLEDVLASLSRVAGLAGIVVVTLDPAAAAIARRSGARIWSDGAGDGHTGAVAAAARRLQAEQLDMLALPGDVPLVEPGDIQEIIGAAPFAIVPARDEQGSNAVLCAPPGIVPLRFGENSFFPHLDAARSRGIAPKVLRLPRIALDIDTPDDLALLLATPARTRTHALLGEWRIRLDQEIEA
jgi:2-phospho-L-lactate guanylyltransferase